MTKSWAVWPYVCAFSISIFLLSSGAAARASDESPPSGCNLYPIALSLQSLSNAAPGTVLNNISNGAQPGNFGWLSWGGSPGEPALVNSLSSPGNSSTYVNPDDPSDHQVSVGDWVAGKPGVSNSKKIRDALDALKSIDITVPVWDQARGSGEHAAYRVTAFARVRLSSYQLPGENRITARFLGYTTCGAQNLAPNVNAGRDQTILLTASATLAGVVSDDGLPSGGALTVTWSEVSGPGAVTFGNSNAAVTTASLSAAGTYVLRLTATDSQLSSSDDAVVTVDRPNLPPVATSLSVVTNEDAPAGITLHGSDPDNDPLSFTVVVLPQYGTLSGTPPQLLYTPKPDYNGPDSFQFKVNDGQLDSSNAVVSLQIHPVNDPPVADPQSLTNFEDTPFPITLSGSDVEGSPLTYAIVDGPAHGTLTLNSQPSNQYTYTPVANYFGPDAIRFMVNDGTNDSPPAGITITIAPVDDAPLVVAGVDQLIVLPTNSVQLAGVVTYDVFPGAVDFVEWTQLSGPGTTTFSHSTNETTAATFSRSGIYELRLTASDSFLTGSDDLIITVDAPPIVDAGSNQTNTLPAGVTLKGFAGDDGVPTNGALAVSWSKVSGAGSVIFADPNATNTAASFSDSGVYVLRLTADDGIVSAGSDVTVLVNRAPVVDAGSSQSSTNLQLALNGTVFDDGLPGTVPLALLWTTVSGPAPVNFSNPASATTTASFTVGGSYELQLTADDGIATHSATVSLNINQAPVVDAGPDLQAVVGHDLLLQGSMTDDGLPNGSLTATWSVVSGPGAVTLITPNSSMTQVGFDTVGTYVLRLTANDSAAAGSDDVTITVTLPNRAPVASAGPKQVVTLPSSASLAGSVSDDGLPAGGSVAAAWSKVSGPGEVFFTQPGSAGTAASFTQPGDYILRLAASDTELSSFADVQVKVRTPAMNLPPAVSAGSDKVIGLTNIARLEGFVSDDGLPEAAAVTAGWSLVSGPGTVTFDNHSLTNARATFSAVGTYVLRLAATDSALNASDEVTITVFPYNQPPIVDAGPDQTITIPDPAVMMASGLTPTNGNSELSISLSEVAHWDYAIGNPGLQGGQWVFRNGLAVSDGNVFAAGDFQNAGTLPPLPWDGATNTSARSLAMWDGAEWHPFYDPRPIALSDPPGSTPDVHTGKQGTYIRFGVSECVGGEFCNEALVAVAARGSNVFGGGSFKELAAVADGIYDSTARWDGTGWQSWTPKQLNFTPYVIRATDEKIYVGGHIVVQPTNATPLTVTNLPWTYGIITWDGTNWGVLGSGITDIHDAPFSSDFPGVNTNSTYITAMAVATNGDVYAAGSFTMLTPTGYATNIVKWNNQQHRWEPLGLGIQGNLFTSGGALALAENGDLYVGGVPLTSAGGIPVHNIARWDGTRWWPIVYGTNEGVSDGVVAITTHGRDVYIAGRFTEAGGVPAWRFARWDGQFWRGMGTDADDSFNGVTLALASDDSGVYIAGDFSRIGTNVANRIAKWVFPQPPPRVATLNGHVSDDGLPMGAPLSATWTKFAGPGNVTFANPKSPATTASFSQAGTYVLRLSANDTEFTTLDEATIVVKGNKPPTVSAGADQVINLADSVALQASVSDDGLPQGVGLAYVWSVVNGPGTVTFDNPTGTNSAVHFSQAGTYVLRFSANDSQFTVFDDVVFTVLDSVNDNEPPSVNTGSTRTTTYGTVLTLIPTTAHDDGKPVGVTNFLWAQVSGPGIVTFGSPTNPTTTATFSAPGIYFVRLNANDTELASYMDLRIDVNMPGANAAPLVNPGPTQTLTNQLTTLLTGSVSDDGLPVGVPLHTFWSMNSGPAGGQAIFVNSNSPVTYVSFTKAGSYILKLTAEDSAFTASANVAINMPNQSPVPNAGPDRTIVQPVMSLQLNGSATDDGQPSALTASWGFSSAPGTLIFSNTTSLTSTVTFSTVGTYVLQLFVFDGLKSASDLVTVNVAPAGNQPPVVSAVTNVVLTWPSNTVTLNGTISDDGLPAGKTWAQWSTFSGPGTVSFNQSTFTNAQPVATATFSAPGNYVLRLTGSDFALTNGADVTIRVQLPSPVNQPPLVNAGADQTIVVTNTLALAGVVNDDGNPNGSSLCAFWSKVSGPGPVYFAGSTNLTTNVVTSARFPFPGQYVLRLSAADSATNVSDDVTITVLSVDPNLAPVVSAGPDFTVPQYTHQALAASVSDDGLPSGFIIVGWSVISGPGRGYFDNAAAVNTPVTFYLTGTYVLRLTAADGRVSAFDDVTVTVVPPVNDGPIADAGGDLTVVRPNAAFLLGAVYDDGLPFGYPLTYQWARVSGPGTVTFLVAPESGGGGATVNNTTENATHWEMVDGIDAFASATFSTNGEYVLSLTTTDTEFTNTATMTVTVLPGTNSPPVVNAGPDFIVALPDQGVLVSDVTDDGLEEGWIEMYWTAVSGPGPVWFSTLNGTYRATFIAPGEYVLRLTAHDGSLTNHDDVKVTVYDTPPPTAEIQSPLDGAIITSPTNVIGTARSELLQSYVLEYRLKPADSDLTPDTSHLTPWSVLASNTVSVVSNALGQLDPTLSLNGLYELRLTATDILGRSATTDPITVIFDRNLKVGQFTISFTDLAVPVSGLPLQITRTYDSRAAAAGIQGDFGIGWTMDLRNVRLQKNRPLGRNWVETTTGNPFDLTLAYHLDPIHARIVTITFPDGRVEKFQFNPHPLDQALLPIGYPQWRFTPLGSTRGTLVPAGYDDPDGNFLAVVGAIPGTVQLIDLNFFFDSLLSNITDEELNRYPSLFRYTSPEGYKYLIDEMDGLKSVTDPNGNTLVVSTNGLTWTNPTAGTNTLSIAFQRNAAGRITNIIDATGHAMSYAYDTNANLVTYVNRDGNTNAFTYDPNHRLLSLIDARGIQVLNNQYDGQGRLIRSADASGQAMTYGHALDERRDYVTNRLGFVTINDYDERGNIIRVTDPLGAVSGFVYDLNGNLLVKSNATDCHCSVSYTYDDADNRISETDALGNTTRYTYSALRKVVTTTEPSGFATTNTYDANGNLLSTRDSAGQVAMFTYNHAGKVTSMTTRGHTTLYEYDEFGFLVREVNPLGHITEFTVDPNGNILSQAIAVTQITGLASLDKLKKGWLVADGGTPVIIAGPTTNYARLVMRYEYSVGGMPLRTLYYDGSSTETSYDPNGKPSTTTSALGCETHNTWNQNGQLDQRSDCTGCTERFEYDAEGQLTASTDRRGFTTRFEYDARGRLIRTTFPDGSQTSATYYPDGALESETSKSGEVTFYALDANRNRIAVTNSSGTTHYTYNFRNHATSKTDPLGRTTTYEYDGLEHNTAIIYPDGTRKTATFSGRLVTSETDQNGRTTFYDYDPLGRLIAVTDPLNETTHYAYDEQGNKIAESDPLGRTTFFEYDTMKHRVRTIYPDGATTATAYDAGGRAIRQVNQMGDETRYEYDPADHVTKIIDPLGRVTQFTYDCGGNKLTQKTPDGNTTSFEYDTLNRRTLTRFPDGTTEALTFDLPGRMIAQTDQAGKSTGFTYDIRNRLIKVIDPIGQQSLFGYDAVGNRVTETDTLGQLTGLDYDKLNRLVRTTYPDHTTREFAFDGVGRLVAAKDQGGKTTGFTYDAVGRLVSSTDPLGHLTTYTYDAAGNRIAQTDANGKLTRFEYDAMNRRTRTLLPDGSTRSISYDKAGLPVTETDALGHETVFDFDADNERTAIKDALGHTTRFGFDAMGRIASRTDANNQTTTFQYDLLGRLTRTLYPDGASSSATYDARGRRISQTDPNGHTTTFAYDDLDRLRMVTDAMGQATSFAYDTLGRLVSRTDVNGHSTGYDYDQLGRLIRVTYPDGAFRAGSYDSKGRLISATDPLGHTTGFRYDDADRLVSQTDALGQLITYDYDGLGRVTSLTDAGQHTTSFEYDALGRPTRATFADGTTQLNQFDALGRRVAETDQAGVTKQFAYDAVGRMKSVTDALGQSTTFAYDPVGRLIAQTDANGHTTSFEYDARGRRKKRTLPGGPHETFGYDPAGNLITRADFNGRVTAYTYDALNRVTQKLPDAVAGSAPVTFDYNPLGQRTAMTDASGTTTYAYDVRDRLVLKTRALNVGQASSLSTSLNYTYDANGNLTGLNSSTPNGAAATYEYDALNRLTAVNDSRVGRSTYAYDPASNLQTCEHPNSLTEQYAYDALNRLTSLAAFGAHGSNIANYAYTLEPAGHRVSAIEKLVSTLNAQPATLNRSFGYDQIYRLTNETVTLDAQLSALNYSYDPVGNRLARASTEPTLPNQNFSYDADDRLTSDLYDANGNTVSATLNDPISRAARPVIDEYDSEDRLVSRTTTLNSQLSSINIAYDGDGNRVAKTVTVGTNSVTTFYVVDELNPSGYAQVLEEHVSLNSQPSTLNRIYTYGLSLLSEDQFDGAAWRTSIYGADGHGSVRYLTDLSGNVTDRYDYDAFGNLIGQTSSSQLPTPNNYLFAGEQFDPDLGLYYLRARYAEPGRGRFWTADSFGGFGDDPPSLHRYTFNQNDPVNRLDPSGHFTLTETLQVTALAPLVRQVVMSLFDGANHFSHGLAGGSALKFVTRSEAYMIDSLSVGPGWKFGRDEFWATQRGAPFLLMQNPNIFQGKKPCWYECVPFDLDAPVYGPEATEPIFKFTQTQLPGLAEYLSGADGGGVAREMRQAAAYWNTTAADTGWFAAGASHTVGALVNAAANAVSPEAIYEGAERAGYRSQLVMQGELEHGSGNTWTFMQGISSIVGDFVGYNGVMEAGFGTDREHMTLLSGSERWSRGLAGGSQILLTATGLGAESWDLNVSTAVSRAAARAERKISALADLRRPSPKLGMEPSEALTGPRACLEPPSPSRSFWIPDELKREMRRLEAGWAERMQRLEASGEPLNMARTASEAAREQMEFGFAKEDLSGRLSSWNVEKTTTPLESMLQKVDTLDFSTPANKAIFYSGPGQGARAAAFAERTGGMTIEMTAGGRALAIDPVFQSLSPAEQFQVWQRASTPFAKGASGNVNAFIKGARPDRTFRTVEEPILDADQNVYRYTYHY